MSNTRVELEPSVKQAMVTLFSGKPVKRVVELDPRTKLAMRVLFGDRRRRIR